LVVSGLRGLGRDLRLGWNEVGSVEAGSAAGEEEGRASESRANIAAEGGEEKD
jgi:hypothetical protein